MNKPQPVYKTKDVGYNQLMEIALLAQDFVNHHGVARKRYWKLARAIELAEQEGILDDLSTRSRWSNS